MEKSLIPQSYEDWRYCITVECGLDLTPRYISERIASLQDDKNHYTRQFAKLYGQQHLQKVIGWFTRAQNEA